ncbi:olfactory receptor 5AR1-like [Discoglossus pictus]
MDQTNHTMVSYFIIKGITDVPKLQAAIFLLVLFIYLMTLGGNITILHLTHQDPRLHTPMYFFLGNLSLMDIAYTTVTLHKVLIIFISGNKTVSCIACFSQFYVFASLTADELLILTAMSYDRYVAICNPMHYHMVMSHKVCAILAIFCWVCGFIEIIPFLVLFSDISCYKSNVINHFFCDFVPLVKLSCSDTSALETLMFTEGFFLSILTPFVLTFISYVCIIITILKIRSSIGRRKAFYTCSSHLTVVILLYVTLNLQYIRPSSSNSLDSNKLFSLFNTAAVPLLNPLIYSLKNKDMKAALRHRLRSFKSSA